MDDLWLAVPVGGNGLPHVVLFEPDQTVDPVRSEGDRNWTTGIIGPSSTSHFGEIHAVSATLELKVASSRKLPRFYSPSLATASSSTHHAGPARGVARQLFS